MPTSISIGFSQKANPQEAAFDACVQAKHHLESHQTDLAILFTSIHYAQTETLDVIASVLKPKHLVGCSSGGIIAPDGVFRRGIGILTITSDDLRYGTAAINNIGSLNLREAGFEFARKLTQDLNFPQRSGCLMFSDILFKNNSQFVRGAQEVLGSGFPIIGAISSDDFRFKKTYQYHQEKVLTNTAVGVLLGGDIAIALGSQHGWKPLGKPRYLTQVQEHVIRTIDHKPAVHIYEEFLGAEAVQLQKGVLNSYAILYPLGIYLENEKQYLLRNAVDILPDGSIVCQGEIPEGAEVHLMIGNKDACRQAAIGAAQEVKDALGGRQAKALLIIESLARHKILGRSSFSEIQAIKDVLGYTTPLIGMYSYGEIGPFGSLDNIKSTHLHNENIMIVAIN